MDDDADPFLYPNAEAGEKPDVSVSRRRLLAGSATAGALATAGCVGSRDAGQDDDSRGADSGAEDQQSEQGPPTVFVFNTGDGSVSIVDAEREEVVETRPVGLTASFPSNQYSPELTDDRDDHLWINVDRGVTALDVGSLSEAAAVETGSGANWLEQTPDGAAVVVSAREPAHKQYRIDADPSSETFGEVTAEIDRTDEGGRGDNDGPGPCDVTILPDGRYAYVPDLFGDTLTVLDVDSFEIVTQVDVSPVGDAPAAPWMGTASWDGEWLLVEHDEGEHGTESIWDLRDPAEPAEAVRLTGDDGLGQRPLTSEIGPDSETGYVFTPGSEDVTVVDLAAGDVTDRVDLGGSAFVGTWGPAREKLYVPVQTNDEVAVIEHASGELTATLDVGSEPYGATAATARPDSSPSSRIDAMLADLDVWTGESGTSYCIGECGCGHEM